MGVNAGNPQRQEKFSLKGGKREQSKENEHLMVSQWIQKSFV